MPRKPVPSGPHPAAPQAPTPDRPMAAAPQASAPAAAPTAMARESAQHIWLAGLGALSKAQEEGNKVFETLVQEGLELQRKAQAAAGEQLAQASSRVSAFAQGMGRSAAGPWDRLETIFDDRVARALARLGLPTAQQWHDVQQRLAALEQAAAAQADGACAPPPAARKRRQAG